MQSLRVAKGLRELAPIGTVRAEASCAWRETANILVRLGAAPADISQISVRAGHVTQPKRIKPQSEKYPERHAVSPGLRIRRLPSEPSAGREVKGTAHAAPDRGGRRGRQVRYRRSADP